MTVSNPAKWLLLMLAFVVTSCAPTPRRNALHVPDWQETAPGPVIVASDPAIAPPASDMPAAAPGPKAEAGQPKKATAPIPAPPALGWVSLQRWSQSSGFATLLRLASTPVPSFALRSTAGVFVFGAGTETARWDGLELRLSFAPQMIGGEPFVHSLDLQKGILPLLDGTRAPMLYSGAVVVLDPGHGGEDAGTRSVLGPYYEKDFALDWALRVQALLCGRGYRVWLTRSNDVNTPLSNRVSLSAEHQASLFISLHFNAAGSKDSEMGLETYCLTPRGAPSTLTRGYLDDINGSYPNNGFDTENLRLAVQIHRELLQVNGQHDRGVRRVRFPAVLRGQQCPAVLVEGGYLSNPREARLIAEPGYRQKLAEAVARALLPGELAREGTANAASGN